MSEIAGLRGFHFFWPVLCLWLSPRWLLRIAIAGILVAPVFRLAGGAIAHNYVISVLQAPGSLDGLGIGAVLALMRRAPSGWVAAAGLAIEIPVAILIQLGVWTTPRVALDRFGFALLSWWIVGRAAEGFGGPIGRILS